MHWNGLIYRLLIFILSAWLGTSCTTKNQSLQQTAVGIKMHQLEGQEEKTAKNQTFTTIDVDCGQDGKVVIDTTFVQRYRIRVVGECALYNDYQDTIELAKNSYQIRNWKAQQFIVSSTLFDKEFVISRQTFKDSLATDLLANGILSTPFKFQFHPDDKSVSFKVFIGYADTDNGDVYRLKLTRTGKPIVLGVETLDDWTD